MRETTDAAYSAKVIHGEYYPHIDGIRALAVLPVVLFHVLASLCPGGFVGVDVFFVISGYLITGGILRDLEKGRFTIRNFYHRRIRRIMPAYFAMIACVFAAGCLLYYAKPLVDLGDAMVKSTLFLANIHFWFLYGNYFAPQLHSLPLLHLWSLSVEEQFYLFIPLLCALLWKIRRQLVAPALALLASCSLLGAVCAVLGDHQKSAFYLLQYRAWELLAGSLLALLPSVRLQPTAPRALGSLLAGAGLLLVLATCAGISSATPFPGLSAIPPVVGTVLLIRHGREGWVGRLLSQDVLVAVGKISYSLYLWHWPVTVFWKYVVYDQLGSLDYLGMFLLSLLLGYLSWRIIEMPVRSSPLMTPRRSFAFAATGIVCLVALGVVCVRAKGWPTALHPQANEWAGEPRLPPNPLLSRSAEALLRRFDRAAGTGFCDRVVRHKEQLSLVYGFDANTGLGAEGRPTVLLIGDSHAGALRYGLDAVLRENGLCGRVVNCSSTDMFDKELPDAQAAFDAVRELPPQSCVILVERWLRHEALSEQTCDKLRAFARDVEAQNKRLLVVTDVPNFPYAYAELAARMQIVHPRRTEPEWLCYSQTEQQYERMQGAPINRCLADVCAKTGATLVPLHLALKEAGRFAYFAEEGGKKCPLYKDNDHLSTAGSLRAARFILSYLDPATLAKPH